MTTTTGFHSDTRFMEKVSRDSFNDILVRKVSEKMKVPRGFDMISAGGRLYEDYALDSLDVMEVIMEAEAVFGIKVPNEKIFGIREVIQLWDLVSSC